MTRLNHQLLDKLKFYVTSEYACGYLPGKLARSIVATPENLITSETYGYLVQLGFRRSGLFTYRPHCDKCQSCVPVRVCVSEFEPSRSQRRTLKKHRSLQPILVPIEFSQEHFELYLQYQKSRHPGGGMDNDDSEQYRSFLMQSRVDSQMIEFRDNGKLCMVSLIDRLSDGLSAVYTFYDCSNHNNSYGVYNILWQIEHCYQENLPYLYLGYWIADSKKMSYKSDFFPIQGLYENTWLPLAHPKEQIIATSQP